MDRGNWPRGSAVCGLDGVFLGSPASKFSETTTLPDTLKNRASLAKPAARVQRAESADRYTNAIVQASRPASPRFLRDLTDFASLMRSQQHRPRSFDRLEKVIRDGIKAGAFNDISPKLVAELILMAAVDSSAFQRKLG